MNIAEKIRQQRRLSDKTQEEFSKLIGVSLKTVQRWENGERTPRIGDIQRIAQVLNIPASELLNNDTEENAPASPQTASASSPDSTRNDDLVYEWGGDRRIVVPNTPETRAMFERIMLAFAGQPSGATTI